MREIDEQDRSGMMMVFAILPLAILHILVFSDILHIVGMVRVVTASILKRPSF